MSFKHFTPILEFSFSITVFQHNRHTAKHTYSGR